MSAWKVREDAAGFFLENVERPAFRSVSMSKAEADALCAETNAKVAPRGAGEPDGAKEGEDA